MVEEMTPGMGQQPVEEVGETFGINIPDSELSPKLKEIKDKYIEIRTTIKLMGEEMSKLTPQEVDYLRSQTQEAFDMARAAGLLEEVAPEVTDGLAVHSETWRNKEQLN